MSLYRNLFPPMLPSSVPAYDGTQETKIYFNISPANTRDQIKHVQVIINKLIDNKNALNTSIDAYKLGIIFYKNNEIFFDAAKQMHYITLPPNLLPLDNTYRLQIRLGKQDIEGVTLDINWLNNQNNIKDFSEWSNVCLIKPITAPSFELVNFQTNIEPNSTTNVVNSNTFQFIGSYAGTESLTSYRMVLLDSNNNILSDSGDKFITYPISHTFDYNLLNNTIYYVKFIIKTKNGYEAEKVYKVLTKFKDLALTLNATITPVKNSAKIIINIQGQNQPDNTIVDRIYLRRSSSKTNFTKWEDIAVFLLSTQERVGSFNKTYEDLFVESGIVYKYAVQGANATMRGTISEIESVIFDYEHSWLIENEDKQLMVGYNAQISNMHYVVKEAVIETFNKYPYVIRNANTKYRTFDFSATLTYNGDFDLKYLKDTGVYVNNDMSSQLQTTYNNFYKNNNANYVLEREFRNLITEMLYNGKPKLFKSDTEGLILVYLTNISLQPKNELGRTVYDFSCTMTEIEEPTFENLVKFGIKKGV